MGKLQDIDRGMHTEKAAALNAYEERLARMRNRAATGAPPTISKATAALEDAYDYTADEEDLQEPSAAALPLHSGQVDSSEPAAASNRNMVTIGREELKNLLAAVVAKSNTEDVREEKAAKQGYIKIDNAHIHFTITYPVPSQANAAQQSLTVGMYAYNIDANNDAITIVTDNSVDFKLPKLEKILVEYSGKKFITFWAGGQSTFGNLKYTSFLISDSSYDQTSSN